MGTATFKCECGETVVIHFKPGNKPEAPICKKCSKPMVREFKNLGVGDIVDDECMSIGRMMTYHSTNN